MKKAYEKPMVAVENYELSQAISACENIKIGFANAKCVLNDPDSTKWMKVFAVANYFLNSEACPQFHPYGMESNDKICYHTSTGSVVFTS